MFTHQPVMINETIKNLVHDPAGTYLDCTFGLGGHSKKILENLNDDGRLIAIDRDKETVSYSQKIKDKRFHFKNLNFSKIESLDTRLDGIFFDLGNSSMQLDDPERGFSFQKDGPLDMRMGNQSGPTASDIINLCSEATLADLIFFYGQERKARKIANKIVKERNKRKINTTLELAEIIRAIVPKNFKKDPATKTFQAIRIAVNNELKDLSKALVFAEKIVRKGGIIAVVTFHSLEDKIVKDFGKIMSGKASSTNRYSPPTSKTYPSLVPINKKPVVATIEELDRNKRARSAKLRVYKKVSDSPSRVFATMEFPQIELGI